MKTLGRILIIVLVISIISAGFYGIMIAVNGGTVRETQNFEGKGFERGEFNEGERPEGGRGEHGEHGTSGGELTRNLLKVSGAVLVIAGGTWAVDQLRKKKQPAAA